MPFDLWSLYSMMLRGRLVEEAVRTLWLEGRISGEMHLGLGEEAIVAGVTANLEPDDALALDHRGTLPLVMIGAELEALLLELLGQPQGLCRGMGGHMHLFSPEHRAASSGIVGASGPTAAGFALAAQLLRPGSVAVAYFGEGAINQGMLMESFNLAGVWNLPVLFVCKDNDWSITTRSSTVTTADPASRAKGFGLPVWKADGWKVEQVFQVANEAIGAIRAGDGPGFLHLRCVHLEGHFLGDPLLRVGRHPVAEGREIAVPLARSATSPNGASPVRRAAGLGSISWSIARSVFDDKARRRDPIAHSRATLNRQDKARLSQLEMDLESEVASAVARVLG
jgi:TPP-dependent pyruvate/acetoin dehydrogenase alpha subunit